MMCFYPYIFVTLLMIYPRSTVQLKFEYGDVVVADLKEEEPGVFGSRQGYIDVACNDLTPKQKQDICDEAMKWAVANEPFMTATDGATNRNCRNIRVGKFLDVKSTLAVPRLASPSDPYTCRKMSIEGMQLERRMWWCMNRVFMVENSNKMAEAEGFFMSGSRDQLTRIFIFKPSKPDNQKVVPWAKVYGVPTIPDAYEQEDHYLPEVTTTSKEKND